MKILCYSATIEHSFKKVGHRSHHHQGDSLNWVDSVLKKVHWRTQGGSVVTKTRTIVIRRINADKVFYKIARKPVMWFLLFVRGTKWF
jgi:hypothetical protein